MMADEPTLRRKGSHPIVKVGRHVLLVPVLAISLLAPSWADEVPQSRDAIRLSFVPVVKRVAPAVVNIYSRRVVESGLSPFAEDPFFHRFFGEGGPFSIPRQRVENSLGSGVIIGANGIVVTNHHVVAGATEITVVLSDRREIEATVVGSDERTDLAVLKLAISGEILPVLEYRDSDTVEVGELVLAVGNPFGVGQTVTSGIVSAEARTRVGITDLNFFIQTDAAINPGNSGGALVDVDGRLIGINTAIYARSGGSLGIGFAVPSNMVRAVVDGFLTAGRPFRPWLGAWGKAATSDLADGLGLPHPGGVVLEDIYPDGPASEAGAKVGDVILAVNGRPVEDDEALAYRVATLPLDRSAELTVWRKRQQIRLPLRVEEPPEDPPRDTTEVSGRSPLTGAIIANVSPAIVEELGERRVKPGVVILDVKPEGIARRVGLHRGDRIVSINGRTVNDVRDVTRLVGQGGPRWNISIGRGQQVLNLKIDT